MKRGLFHVFIGIIIGFLISVRMCDGDFHKSSFTKEDRNNFGYNLPRNKPKVRDELFKMKEGIQKDGKWFNKRNSRPTKKN